MYASFLGISEALHLDIFHQPRRSWFLDSPIDMKFETADLNMEDEGGEA
jgi:hypothetical protein